MLSEKNYREMHHFVLKLHRKGVNFLGTVLFSKSEKINIIDLKRFALERLPKGDALKEVLLAEKDTLPAQEFLAKLDVWLKLLAQRSRGRIEA